MRARKASPDWSFIQGQVPLCLLSFGDVHAPADEIRKLGPRIIKVVIHEPGITFSQLAHRVGADSDYKLYLDTLAMLASLDMVRIAMVTEQSKKGSNNGSSLHLAIYANNVLFPQIICGEDGREYCNGDCSVCKYHIGYG